MSKATSIPPRENHTFSVVELNLIVMSKYLPVKVNNSADILTIESNLSVGAIGKL